MEDKRDSLLIHMWAFQRIAAAAAAGWWKAIETKQSQMEKLISTADAHWDRQRTPRRIIRAQESGWKLNAGIE